MKPSKRIVPALFAIGTMILCAGSAFAQGRGGGGPAGTAGIALPMPKDGVYTQSQRPGALNDMEITAVSRIELDPVKSKTLEPLQDKAAVEVKAVADARAALVAASLKEGVDSKELAARAKDIATADLALAATRSTTLAEFAKKEFSNLSPAKLQAVVALLETARPAGGRGGR